MVFHDIGERKRAEAELTRYRRHLEELVDGRTAELADAKEAAEAFTRVLEGQIVEREQVEASLRHTQYTVDHAALAVFWIDPETGRFRYVNERACHNLGYERERLLSLSVPDINPDAPSARWPELAERIRRAGSLTFESHHRRADGQVFPVEITSFLSRYGDGEHIVSFVSDISLRKQAEAAMIQAKEAAESANRAKSVFLANMSHELRTPLNAILGFAQLMERDPGLGEHHRQELATINRSGHHLLELINDVLEISRIEAGRLSLQLDTFNLPDTLDSIEAMIRGRAHAKELSFRVECPQGLPTHVSGDAGHLRQVLVNLLGNAVKYTDRGAVTLRLFVNGDAIRFEVEDTGPGVAAEELERIFHPFYQTAEGIAKGEGTGLGLTISRQYVQLMGGKIEVASEPGQSTRFSFTLPLPAAPPPAAPDRAPRRVTGLAPGQPPVRVLVAEDHAESRQLLTRLLEAVGLEVRAARNGRRAVDCFREWRPQLIWMDMRLPELDGYQATREIRSLPGGDGVRIVALTASAFEEDRKEILAAGCDDVLAKPLDVERLFEVLGRLLGLRYRYTEQAPAEAERLSGEIDLGALPAGLRAELATAAEHLDLEACREIAGRIRGKDAGLADTVESLVTGFQFDRLLRALEPDAGS